MTRIIICACICAAVWLLNLKNIISGLKRGPVSEFYTHLGLSLFFSLLCLELLLGLNGAWKNSGILLLKITGFVLYAPAAYLTVSSLKALKTKGKPEDEHSSGLSFYGITGTSKIVDSGIYGIVRQPMTLGMSIWSLALIAVFQTIPSLIIGAVSIVIFYLAAKSEIKPNIEKFGEPYKEYMKNVPMWNFLQGLRKKK